LNYKLVRTIVVSACHAGNLTVAVCGPETSRGDETSDATEYRVTSEAASSD
jgi:hypothetical protein